ncbi:hypothetical protein J9303_01110 [Bacillaceae bacterium Marseille-Q3522]|nr:hypothetical protein [Bacillaceae bacterium Marseille-Q3522]
MLVDINLLPEKEHRKNKYVKISFVFLVLFLVCLLSGFFLYHFYERKIASVQESISEFRQEQEKINQQLTDSKMEDNVLQIEKYLTWIETHTLKAVPISEKLSLLIQEQGQVENFQYRKDGTIYLRLHLNSGRDPANLLKAFLDQEWVSNADIISVQLTEEASNPHYIGEYEITLNKERLMKQQQGGQQKGSS